MAWAEFAAHKRRRRLAAALVRGWQNVRELYLQGKQESIQRRMSSMWVTVKLIDKHLAARIDAPPMIACIALQS